MSKQKDDTPETDGLTSNVPGAQEEKIPTNSTADMQSPTIQSTAGDVVNIQPQPLSASSLASAIRLLSSLPKTSRQSVVYKPNILGPYAYLVDWDHLDECMMNIYANEDSIQGRLNPDGMFGDSQIMPVFPGASSSPLIIMEPRFLLPPATYSTVLNSDISLPSPVKKQSRIRRFFTVKTLYAISQRLGLSKVLQTTGRLVRAGVFHLWVWGSQMLKFVGLQSTPKD